LVGALASVCGVSCCLAAGAFALPAGREYEMVSPVYKGGFGAINIGAVASNGESVAFYSPGAFKGAQSGADFIDYLARRSASEWSTAPLMPPAASMAVVDSGPDVSPTLDTTLVLGRPGANWEKADQEGTEGEFLLHPTNLPDTSAGWELGGIALEAVDKTPLTFSYEDGSADFCHLLLAIPTGRALLSEAVGTTGQVYELDRGCNGEPVSLGLVGVNNRDKLINRSCKVDIGIQDYTSIKPSAFNAISADGGEVFFTDCLGPQMPHQLFVRLGEARTLEVSKPVKEACVEVPCKEALKRASAEFDGASEDGSRVFFTTTARLTEEDKDTGNDLYMATIDCPEGKPECEVAERTVTSLVQASHDPTIGEAADVQGVVRVAPDGERAYFVAGGDLLSQAEREGLEREGRPVPHVGADNLYVYDSAPPSKVAFIGDLCLGKQLSGSVEDIRCPNATGTDTSLWYPLRLGTGGEAQTAGADGRFLVFSTYAQLVANDTDSAKDVYRYDAQTGALERVSLGEAGHDGNGNDSSFDAGIEVGHSGGTVLFQYEMDNRAISENGSRIVFRTAEPLSPAASNGLTNVYEWHEEPGWSEGRVSLVSSGTGEQPVKDVVISPEGNDIFFVTVQGLVLQDTDGAPDVYDARLNGGFPPAPAERRPCEGDACQGPLTNPAPLLVPGSVPQAPGGNFAPPASKHAVKAKPKKKVKAKKKRSTKKGKASGRSGNAGKATGRSGR
jgi:hypothetical protein